MTLAQVQQASESGSVSSSRRCFKLKMQRAILLGRHDFELLMYIKCLIIYDLLYYINLPKLCIFLLICKSLQSKQDILVYFMKNKNQPLVLKKVFVSAQGKRSCTNPQPITPQITLLHHRLTDSMELNSLTLLIVNL